MNELQNIFQNVNDWLKFAEAKHSGLIALTSALLLATPTVLKQPKKKFIRFLFLLPILFFSISLYISLKSFSPVLERKGLNVYDQKIHSHIFFESIASMDIETFKTDLLKSGETLIHLDTDKIDQIIINSKITSLKMRAFRESFLYFKIGFGVLLILLICDYIFVRRE